MFSSSNLKTFRFLPPKSSLEKAEKKNTVEQKLLDKKLKFFESEQTLVQRELYEIRKEKYSRNFYRTAPHIEDERLQHSRYLDVAVSTNKQNFSDENNNLPEPNQKAKNTSSRAKKKEDRRALISASGVERTISSMKNASASSNYSFTPGQVVRVSIPAELETKIKISEEFDAKKYLAKRRHSVHLGSGISGKLLFAEHLLNLTKNNNAKEESLATKDDKLQIRRRMSLPSQPLVAFQKLCKGYKNRCNDIIEEEEEEEEEEDFIDDDIDINDLYIKDDPVDGGYEIQYIDNEDKENNNNDDNNNTITTNTDVNDDNIPDDQSVCSSSSMITRQCEFPSLDCVSVSSRSNSFTESNADQDQIDLEKLLENENDVFVDDEEHDDFQNNDYTSEGDKPNEEQSTGDILKSIQSFTTNFTLPVSNLHDENTTQFIPQPPAKSSTKPKRFRKRSQSLSIPFSRISKSEDSTSKSSFIHPTLAKRRGSYSHPKITRRKSLSNEENTKAKNEPDSTKTSKNRTAEATISKTNATISLSNENISHLSNGQRGKTAVTKTLSLNFDNRPSDYKATMESLNEQYLNTPHRLAKKTQSDPLNSSSENCKTPKIPMREDLASAHRPLSRAMSDTGNTKSTKKEHFPSMNTHRSVLRTKSLNDNSNNNSKTPIRIKTQIFPKCNSTEDKLDNIEEVNSSPRKMKLQKSFSTPCNDTHGREGRFNSIAAIHTIAFPTSNLITSRSYRNATEIASKNSFENSSLKNHERSNSLPSVHSKNSSSGSEYDFSNNNKNITTDETSSSSGSSSSKRITDREQQSDGRLPHCTSTIQTVESIVDISPVEESLLRQAYLKRVEIQESAKKMMKLSQHHFGDSRAPTPRGGRVLARTPVFGTSDEKNSPGIKKYDLSNKSRKWKRYVRSNNEEIEGVLQSVNHVTDCRYLRCSSIEKSSNNSEEA